MNNEDVSNQQLKRATSTNFLQRRNGNSGKNIRNNRYDEGQSCIQPMWQIRSCSKKPNEVIQRDGQSNRRSS